MSLTKSHEVFGSIHETGINDILNAFFSTRPRYLNYGSSAYVPSTTVNSTQMSPIPFPGVPGGGIDWAIRFSTPRVDLFDQDQNLPPELNLNPGQLAVHTAAEICIDCRRKVDEEDKPRDDEEKNPREGEAKGPCFKVRVAATGHLQRTWGADGDAVRIVVDQLELIDIKPDELEAIIECLLLQILRAVLREVRLPLQALRAGAFTLSLVQGPEIEDDQIKMYGNLI